MKSWRPLQLAKDLKHAQWVARRRLPEARRSLRDRTFRAMDRIRPYAYRDGAFPDSFVSRTIKPVDDHAVRPFPLRIFVMWTGENPLTPNRAEALEEIREVATGLKVILVTPTNLGDWLLPEAPLHPAYANLSLIHRSDYLRAYLLHHHGGAYLDIKRGYADLLPALERFADSPAAWVVGYRELGADYVSDEPGTIYRALRRHHGLLLGNGAFAARPGTPLTAEWRAELERRMDGWAESLATSPGNTFGTNDDYPVPWAAVQGAVFQPLCLKYCERVLIDDRLKPSFENYR